MNAPVERSSGERSGIGLAVVAAIGLAFGGGSAAAQDVTGLVASGWASFIERCGGARADPNAFLQTHPPHNPAAGVVVDSSPDGQVVVTRMERQGHYRQIEFLGTPGGLIIICVVSVGSQPGGHGEFGYGVLMLTGLPFPDALHAHATALPQTAVAGGEADTHMDLMPPEIAALAGGMIPSHIDAITTPIGGKPSFVYGYAGGFSIHLTGAYSIEVQG